jgi:predicted HAD superfamily Cof-like phosphohydrolase
MAIFRQVMVMNMAATDLQSAQGLAQIERNRRLSKMKRMLDTDSLDSLFDMQQDLMKHYNRAIPNGIPEWPCDFRQKVTQRFVRDTISRAQDEMFEAKHHLKQAKEHRNIDTGEFDRSEFVEEMVDALHFYLEAMILMGVTPNELFESYARKNEINRQRIRDEFEVE